jgi:galactitol-specific phosphotransferase system IIB component
MARLFWWTAAELISCHSILQQKGEEVLKKVLVATGTSVHKREFAVNYIKSYFQKNSIDAEVVGDNIYELKLDVINPDLIVTIGPQNFTTDIPIVQGAAFVTQIGMEAACSEIVNTLNKS